MKNLALITLLSIFTVQAYSQNVGIGLTTPLRKLHVKGTIRTDSLMLTHPGANDAVLSLQTNEVISFAENLHILYTIPVDGSLWQSFTAEATDTIQYISIYFNGPCLSDSMKIYTGTGTEGPLIATVAISGSGWIQSPDLNLPVTNGQEYTFAMSNVQNVTFSADTYDGGGFYFNNDNFLNYSITFAVYKVSAASEPLLVKGIADSITGIAHPLAGANLDLQGTISVNHMRLRGGAGDGNVLTSDANGFTTWTTPSWKNQNGYICLADLERSVGIGTLSPSAKLHIAGPEANLLIGDDFTPGPFNLMTVLGDGNVRFQNSSGDLRFAIDNDGLVSIGGGPAFDARLSVHGQIWTEALRMQNGAQNGYVLTSDVFGNGHWMPNNSSSYWDFDNNNIHFNQNGNVGIGTDTPEKKLDVVGEGKFTNNLTIGGNLGLGIDSPAERLDVSGSGKFSGNLTAGVRIGIGTYNPSFPLHVVDTGDSPLAHFEGQGNNLSIIEIQDLQKVMELGLNAGTGVLNLLDNTPFQISLGGSIRMYMAANGNVGIGNWTPTERLHVNGKTRTDQLQIVTGATNGYLLSSDTNGNASWISKDAAGYWTKNINDISSNVTGNIGLGISTPLAKLHIVKNVASSSANDFMLLENSVAGGVGFKFKNTIVPTSLWQTYVENDGKFKIGRDGIGDFVTILTDGKVGIGNSAPTYAMHIKKTLSGSGANDFLMIENATNGGAGIRFKNTQTATIWQVYEESNGKFTIGRHNVTEDLTILENGDMGIGTATPGAKLDVNGAIKTKYSGSIVPSEFVSTGLQTKTITIPALPAGYDFTNTVVLVTNSDGTAVFTIHQVKLTSLTTIDVKCTVINTGNVRLNYVVFKI